MKPLNETSAKKGPLPSSFFLVRNINVFSLVLLRKLGLVLAYVFLPVYVEVQVGVVKVVHVEIIGTWTPRRTLGRETLRLRL